MNLQTLISTSVVATGLSFVLFACNKGLKEDKKDNEPNTTPPTLPSSLTASNITNSRIDFSWTASEDADQDEISYLVSYKKQNDSWNKEISTNQNKYTLKNLERGASYLFRVRAKDSQGDHSQYATSPLIQTSLEIVLGGKTGERADHMIQTNDKGYVITGYKKRYLPPSTIRDIYVVKLDSAFNLEWEKVSMYGDDSLSVIQKANGHYMIGTDEMTLVELSPSGKQISRKNFTAGRFFFVKQFTQTSDNGYAFLGGTVTLVGDAKRYDSGILKVKSDETKEWVANVANIIPSSFIQSNDSHYVIAGTENRRSAVVLKLNSTSQTTIWRKSFSARYADFVIQTNDSHYVVAGRKNDDAWVAKFKSTDRTIIWEKTFDQEGDTDSVHSIIQTSDGGYVVLANDAWILKLDSSGNKVWDKNFGGEGLTLTETDDGHYIVAGFTTDKGAGQEDIWIVKLDTQGNLK